MRDDGRVTIRSTLLFLLPTFAFAQLSVGVKGGVPFNDILEGQDISQSIPLITETKRFTIGPAIEFRLPAGFSVEFDALYKRFDQVQGTETATGDSWEFPLLGKYRFPIPLIRPYIEGGITFNHLSNVLNLEVENRKGFAGGLGLEFKVPYMRLSAGLRYSHLEAKLAIPSTNQADLLFGIMFP